MDDQGAELPNGDGVTRFSYCPSHIAMEDGMTDLKANVKALDQRLGALVTEVTKTQTQMGSLIDEMQKDRADRKAEREHETQEREKDRQTMQQNITFYQNMITCNNKAGIKERKELIKYGGKVVLILLVAVCGVKVVTAAMGIPFP